MKVFVRDVRQITNVPFDHIDATFGEVVEVENDLYWDIDSAQRDDVYEGPTTFGIGSLIDEYEWLHALTTDDPAPINYQLVWLGALLRAIGELPECTKG